MSTRTSSNARVCDGATFGDVTTLLHLGACSSTTERDADYLMRNNYEYTKHLARWSLERDVRFLYASSAATYGALEEGLSDEADLRRCARSTCTGTPSTSSISMRARNGFADPSAA